MRSIQIELSLHRNRAQQWHIAFEYRTAEVGIALKGRIAEPSAALEGHLVEPSVALEGHPVEQGVILKGCPAEPDMDLDLDLDSGETGSDFADVIRETVDSCSVLVALIGRQWATIADEQGRRRLDLPRIFRTADLWLIHAADCCSRYSSWTCCGVRY